MLGFSYDWNRVLATTDPEYVRWTQWIFLVLFDTWFDPAQQKGRPIAELPIPADVAARGEAAVAAYRDAHRLAYQSEAPVNWCPALGTVLANEEVIGGVSERGGHPVVRIPLRQWMLRITAYADRLEKELDGLDWPASIKKLQCDWIGRSTGAEVDFFIAPAGAAATAFAALEAGRAAAGFPDEARRRRPAHLHHAARHALRRDLHGHRPGASARRPTHDARPAGRDRRLPRGGRPQERPRPHRPGPREDRRLHRLARASIRSPAARCRSGWPTTCWPPTAPARSWPCRPTTTATSSSPRPSASRSSRSSSRWTARRRRATLFTGDGRAVALRPLHRPRRPASSSRRVAADLEAAGLGRPAVNYKLRDWLFSRQRFWGEPFPILHELDAAGNPTGAIRAVDERELPVHAARAHRLQAGRHARPAARRGRRPSGCSSSATASGTAARPTRCRSGPARAGTTCGSSTRRTRERFVDPEVEQAWMPVDLYVGGAEHAVLHLLYCAVLAQGALRPRPRLVPRALRQARQPGHDPRRDGVHRLPQRQGGLGVGRTSRRTDDTPAPRAGRSGGEAGGALRAPRRARRSASRAGPTRCRRAAATW